MVASMTYDSSGESYVDMMRRSMTRPRRLQPRVPGSMSTAQVALYDRIKKDRGVTAAKGGFGVTNEDGSLVGPWNAYVAASPAIGESLERLARACRHDSSCPSDVSEVGILAIAARRRAEFEWYAHERLAVAAGVAAPTIADVKNLVAPPRLRDASRAQRAAYAYALELDATSRVSDKTHAAVLNALGGEQPLVDLVMTLGLYSHIALLLNAFQVPLPPGIPLNFPREQEEEEEEEEEEEKGESDR